MEKMAFNRFKVPIRRCCASCLHKVIGDDGVRICRKMNLVVEALFCCNLWTMAKQWIDLRISRIKVK